MGWSYEYRAGENGINMTTLPSLRGAVAVGD
jgi:hypothetical protein